MLLTVFAQNLKRGGLDETATGYGDRWPKLLDRFDRASRPIDLLLLSEAWRWDEHNHKRVARAMHDLGLTAMPLTPGRSGNGTLILYRVETMGRWVGWDTGHVNENLHGLGVAFFDLGMPGGPLAVASAHFDPYRYYGPADEANIMATRATMRTSNALIVGDINFPPADGVEPDYRAMRPYNAASRTELVDPGAGIEPTPYRGVAWTLMRNGFTDVAAEMAKRTGDKSYLAHTARMDRVDQAWATKPVTSAVRDCTRHPDPDDASDHDGIEVTIDTDLIDTSNVREFV
ncbi:hypothetical protein [Alloactinosynnema sp. L-07]|uniref:endonuclease/exonuclease/phosphatase family protein n=1 Tax=Alloactinosynnema sp. L-07 TaxID=1653480 RepID=UPI00065F027D|nr:endonuclease/exonuclease/phosphatase family protein [Alloactinosynnema sp. L-07]CRK56904.1 hypothetical protein [Alloactinosynnema sp. L-07]